MQYENKMYLLILLKKQILKAEIHRQSIDTVKEIFYSFLEAVTLVVFLAIHRYFYQTAFHSHGLIGRDPEN